MSAIQAARSSPSYPLTFPLLRLACCCLRVCVRLCCLQIEHLDGHKVQIGTSGITRPGETRWFQGEGMPQLEKVRKHALWLWVWLGVNVWGMSSMCASGLLPVALATCQASRHPLARDWRPGQGWG